MEKDDEVMGSGNLYTSLWRLYESRLGRWLSADPLEDNFVGWSPYNSMKNNPLYFIDPRGDSVLTVFDRKANILYMLDLDHYQKGLPTVYVSPDLYEVDGVYDDNGKLIVNQVMVISGVFTGGQSSENGITYGNNENQVPVPPGLFEILEYSSANPFHDGWFRLDPLDSQPRNDQYDNSKYVNSQGKPRSNIRLHIGSESWGCVTCDVYSSEAIKGFEVMSTVLQKTSTREVRDRLGTLNSLGLKNTQITRYGVMRIR